MNNLDEQFVQSQAIIETVFAGENCYQSTIVAGEDMEDRWGSTVNSPNLRAQLVYKVIAGRSTTHRYNYSLCFPHDFKLTGRHVVMSLHHRNSLNPDRISAPFEVMQDADNLQFILRSEGDSYLVLHQRKIIPGMWYHIIHEEAFRYDNNGYIKSSCNGQDIIDFSGKTIDRLDDKFKLVVGLYAWKPLDTNYRRMYFKL